MVYRNSRSEKRINVEKLVSLRVFFLWITGLFRSVRLCLWWRKIALSCQPVDKEGSKVSYPPAHGGTILNLPKVGGLKSQLSTCTWEFSRPGHKTRFPEFLGAIKKSKIIARLRIDQPHARTIFNRHHLVVIDFIEINRHARRGVGKCWYRESNFGFTILPRAEKRFYPVDRWCIGRAGFTLEKTQFSRFCDGFVTRWPESLFL